MRLLVITQNVDKNNLNLGFFHRWLEVMAKKFDSMEVIALGAGELNLPNNICVHSLGKEKGASRFGKIINFYKLIFGLRKKYDRVFVHMNPEYIVLAGWLWRLWKKPVYLWYVHKSVAWQLRWAEEWVKKIFTANEASCRLEKKDKIVVVGHGIDTDLFKPKEAIKDDRFTILSVGRMSRVKKYEIAIEAMRNVQNIRFLLIAASPNQEGENYKNQLLQSALDNLEILPGIFHNRLPDYYSRADLFVHTSETGSVDKVVLEAMACELPVLTSSEAFDFLPDKYRFEKGNVRELAEKILEFKKEGRVRHANLREIVLKDFSLNNLIDKIHKYVT